MLRILRMQFHFLLMTLNTTIQQPGSGGQGPCGGGVGGGGGGSGNNNCVVNSDEPPLPLFHTGNDPVDS